MRRAVDSIPAHNHDNVLLVVGDFNARTGAEDARFTYHEATKRNGKYLLFMAAEKNQDIANTFFGRREENCGVDLYQPRR